MSRNFPNLLNAWMEFEGAHSAAPKVFIKWAFISMLASAMERKTWIIQPRTRSAWYPNLYIFIVGPAGGGKSSVTEHATELLSHVEGIEFLASNVNDVSLQRDLVDIGRKKSFEWNGQSYPHSAALLFASEAAESFTQQAANRNIISVLTNLFNGGPFGWNIKHGVGRSTLKDGKSMLLNPCINVLACSTPEWLLTKCMTKNDAEGGFGSRILLVVSKTGLAQGKSGWVDEEEGVVEDMHMKLRIIEDLKQVAMKKGPFATSNCFKKAADDFQNKYEAWVAKQASQGMLGGYQQRKMTQLYKVAMCIGAAKRQEMLLLGEDIEEAWEMLEEIEPSMIEALDNLEMSADAKARRDIYEYLLRNNLKIVTKGFLMRTFVKYSMAELNIAIEGLKALGRISIVSENGFTTRLKVHSPGDLKHV